MQYVKDKEQKQRTAAFSNWVRSHHLVDLANYVRFIVSAFFRLRVYCSVRL